MNNPPKPNIARPATPIPITEPPAKETLRALARLVLAAWVVRTLALVAIRIPIYPAVAERTAPIQNATATKGLESSTVVPDHAKRQAAIATKIPKILHSAFKNAIAPLAT